MIMPAKRIILADGSRLLREMLHRVLYKADNLEVVQEVTNYRDLPSAIEQFDPEWVIMSLPSDHVIPDWVDHYIANRPSVRFLAVSTDGSKIKMKWLEPHEEDLGDLSLKDLLHILERDPQKT
jgi:DNA-binding NarL/FixJ family response regulator